MVSLLIWFLASLIYLVDAQLVLWVFSDRVGHHWRQVWLAGPLLQLPAVLLFTPWRAWAAAAIAMTVLLHVTLHAVAMRRLGRLLRPAPAWVVERVAGLARQWGAPAPARVGITAAGDTGPAVAGFLRPVLVLPEAALALPDAELGALLAHELAHLKAHDTWKLWAARVARTLFGWMPFVNKTVEQLALEVEIAADRQAVDWLGDARTYALTLGQWGLRQAAVPAGAGLAGQPAGLLVRLRRLMDPLRPLREVYTPVWIPASLLQKAPAARHTLAPPVTHRFSTVLALYLPLGYIAIPVGLIYWLG